MLAHRYLCNRRLWQASCNYAVRFTQNMSQEVNLDMINLETRLPAAMNKSPQREPFIKNLFLGPFDTEFLYFPEPQSKDRHTQFFEWLQPIEKYIADNLKDPLNVKKAEVLSHLRELGLFRANVDEQYLGLRLNHTELAKVVEVLSAFPWLGSYMVNNHIAPVNIISSMGSAEQKAKYLPKIVTGELIPTICFTEINGGINTNNVNTTAEESDCEQYLILNGEKFFVINGHESNLFVVFSQYEYPQLKSINENSLSVFLVERDFGGIMCENVKSLVGQRDNSVSTIKFNNTKVPKMNLIGDRKSGMKILVDSFVPGNRNIAPQAVGILRHFMKLLVKNVLQRKHMNRNLHEFESIQEVIAKIASTLYSMESILYLTTGMMDLFENQDCMLEKAITEVYCTSECVTRIYEGLQVIGVQSYLRENPYMQIFEDALSYTLFDSYNLDSNTFVALLGLQHSGKYLREHIFKIRNPMFNPNYLLKWLLGKDEQLKLNLAEHMHPSLIHGATLLEKCLAKLQNCTLNLLEAHGREVTDRQMELRRLSEIATRIFVLIAVISRTSRAYCIGLRNAEMDQQVANSLAILTLDRINVLVKEIESSEWDTGDKCHKALANLIYTKKDYFAEHPLNRTY